MAQLIVPTKMTTLLRTVYDLSQKEKGVQERLGHDNRGKEVDVFAQYLDLLGVPWCACFVAYVIHMACLARQVGDVWYKQGTKSAASCTWLVQHLSLDGRIHDVPTQRVFVFFIPSRTEPGKFVHTGFGYGMRYIAGGDITFQTMEGNSNDDGSSEGYEVVQRVRTLRPGMKFADIDPDAIAGVST